jgi:RNA polymerase sigma factor (sigma-70 family)
MAWLTSHYRLIDKRLRALLRRGGRSKEESDDLIQEALLRLHEYCLSARVENHEAFLIRTVRNLSIDRHRSELRHAHSARSVEDLDTLIALQDASPTPDAILEGRERLTQISRVLEAVSRRTRDIYFAHRAGYSYAEIGARLNVSKSTIEKHIARAVLALMDAKDQE